MQQLLAFDAQPSEAVPVGSHAPLQCRRAQTRAMLQACAVTFPADVPNCTTNRHSLSFLRREKDKDNALTERKSSSSVLLPGNSMSLCHRKLKCFLAHPQKHFLQTLPFRPTWHYTLFILSSPTKPFCRLTQGWEVPTASLSKLERRKAPRKKDEVVLAF